jgi:hypothetical protein
MNQKNALKILKSLSLLNFLIFGLIIVFEFLSLFIDFPVLFVSEGDAAGIAEFSGNWFDHFLKILMGIVLIYIFKVAVSSFSADDNENRTKAQAFAVGGSFLVIGIGFLYLLIWSSQFLDLLITNNLEEWIWYAGFRLEILLLFFNLPIISIWKNKAEIFATLDA